jgi:hypothetical protein
MEDYKESTFGSTIRAFAFDGEETKFRSWEGKTLALASSKSFLLALTKAELTKGLTAEEFENAEVESPGVAMTDRATGEPAFAASTMRPTSVMENRKYKASAAAWTYLVASCTDKAHALIERCAGDPFAAWWTILQEKYCSTDAEENYPDLADAFSACNLVEVKKDPELWFNDLDYLNMRIGRINTKYEKDELQMKSHIMNSMSTGYDPVIVKFHGELADIALIKLRKEIILQYKSLLKVDKGKSTSEWALMANVLSKHPYKKFKGTCRNCRKIGHKAAECRLKAVEGKDEVGGKGKVSSDKSNVACYNCGKKGHYSNKCTKPKKHMATSDPTSGMAMFVGVTRLVEKEWDEKADQKERNGDEINNWQDSEFFNFEQSCGDIHAHFDVTLGCPEIMTTTAEDVHMETVESTAFTVIRSSSFEQICRICSYRQHGGRNGSSISGATLEVIYDNTLMTDMRPSNRKIEIGNGDMIETLGQGTVTLMDNDGKLVSFTDVCYAPAFTKQHVVSY